MMLQESSSRKQYPSDTTTDDVKRLQTQVRVFKRWLNCLLKQANARELVDILDFFRDTKNLCCVCKHLLSQKTISMTESSSEGTSCLEEAVAMLERLYGHEISSAVHTAVVEISAELPWDSEAQLKSATNDTIKVFSRHNLLLLGLDTIWIFIVAVRAGTGPPSNLAGSVSSSGSTITRRSIGTHSGSQSQSVNLTSARTLCVDRWLTAQDERLMAWCLAVTEGYSGLNICNFTHSWRDGLAFLAIAHQSRPDLFSYDTRLDKTPNQNLSLAFHLATAEFATPRLLEPVDMHPEHVDARATATYVLEFRKAVERDRKRRSRGVLEIQTAAMSQEGSNSGTPAANVTVLSCSSPTPSTESASDVTWLDDEVDDDSGEESHHQTQPNPDLFDSTIETTLAWLLAMEERFANNDITGSDATMQLDPQFNWSVYGSGDFRHQWNKLSHWTLEERKEIESLLTFTAERLKKLHTKIRSRADEAMEHFEVHEDLMAHLCRRQMSVGRCLRLGNRIIQACRERAASSDPFTGNQSKDEQLDEEQLRIRERLLVLDPDAIQRQTALLSTRWNNLCRASQNMGRRITSCLLRRQGMLLAAVRLQLEKLEAEQSRQASLPFGPSIRELKAQLEVNRSLEEGIEIGEILAERLDNFIMLVPPKPVGKEGVALDREVGLDTVITELASRWGRLVEWVNTRYAKLQNALLHWRHFDEEANLLSDWLTERSEEVAYVMKVANTAILASGPIHLSSRERSTTSPALPVCQTDTNKRSLEPTGGTGEITSDNMQAIIEANEAEIAAVEACVNTHEPRWAQLLASLDRRAQAVREACGDTEQVSRLVEATVDQLVSRWSQLTEPQMSTEDWIDRYSKDIDSTQDYMNQGSEVTETQKNVSNAHPGTTDSHHQASSELLIPDKQKLKVPKTPGADVPPPSPTGYRAEFESKAEELLNWLENSAEALELITMERNRALEVAGQAQAVGRVSPHVTAPDRTENAVQVIERISREVTEWRQTMKQVLTMGERYREELLEVGENIEELDQLFEDVEERWGYLHTLLDEAQRQARVNTNRMEFQQEVSKILKLSQHEDSGREMSSGGGNVTTEVSPPVPLDSNEKLREQMASQLEQIGNQLPRVDEILSESNLFTSPDDLEEQLNNMKTLLRDLLDEQKRLMQLASKRDLFTANGFSHLREQATANDARLTVTCARLKNRITSLQDTNDQVEFFMNQLEGIEKWLADMHEYLDSVSKAELTSVTMIRAQLQESSEALHDMETLEPTLAKVTEVATQLAVYFCPEYRKLLVERLDGLHGNWNEVLQLTKSNRDQLERRLIGKQDEHPLSTATTGPALSDKVTESINTALAEFDPLTNLDSGGAEVDSHTNGSSVAPNLVTQSSVIVSTTPVATRVTASPKSAKNTTHPPGVLEIAPKLVVNLEQLEQWMTNAKNHLANFANVETQDKLESMKSVIQTLTQEIAERRHVLGALDTHTAVDTNNESLTETESMLMRAHFADLESALSEERERLRGALYYLADFNTILGAERRWFQNIRDTLAHMNSVEYTYITELADDTETLDRLSKEHSAEDVDRLDSLAKSLSSARILNSHIQKELRVYKVELSGIKEDLHRTQSEAKSILDILQTSQSQSSEIVASLQSLKPTLCGLIPSGTKPSNDPSQLTECANTISNAEAYVLHLKNEIGKFHSDSATHRFLNRKLQANIDQIQKHLKPVQNLMVKLNRQVDIESKLSGVRQQVEAIEKSTHLLDITSVNPADIQECTEKAKEMLATLNQLKIDLDELRKPDNSSDDNKLLASSEPIVTHLSSLQDRHRGVVMIILIALGRLEDALPLAQKLDGLMTNLDKRVSSIEEVMDYLDTTDCPTSRKDMLQRAYSSLQELCETVGLFSNIRHVLEKLKPLTMTQPTESSPECIAEIERRIECVLATKEAFQSQLEQAELASKDQLTENTTVASQPPASAVGTTSIGSKPTMGQLIDSLLAPDAQVSSSIRDLAREIRDHFKGMVLFNRYCLGTNAPPPLLSAEFDDVKCYSWGAKDYETTVAERIAIIKYFQQQREHLNDRLKEMIVNADGDRTANRLENLLNLQTMWRETNEQIDRRNGHMVLLEHQLNSAQTAISEYARDPTAEKLANNMSIIERLENTYCWKLTADREQLSQMITSNKDASRVLTVDKRTGIDKVFENDSLDKYEFTLRTMARYLNDVEVNLDRLNREQATADLGKVIGDLEHRFDQCFRLMTEAEENLNQIRNSLGKDEPRANERPDNRLVYDDEHIWLKVLLDVQKYRLNAYFADFRTHRSMWQLRRDQWDALRTRLARVKHLMDEFCDSEGTKRSIAESELKERIAYLYQQFAIVRKSAMEVIHADTTEATVRPSNAMDLVSNSLLTEDSEEKPPAVPPRRNSLHRMELGNMEDGEARLLTQELSWMEQRLRNICKRHEISWLDAERLDTANDHATAPILVTAHEDPAPKTGVPHVNSNWMEDAEPIPVSYLDALGPYRRDVEACLRGLNEETFWFIDRSGLVPTSLLKRKSDDILLTSGRTRPSTTVELQLDARFWHNDTLDTDGVDANRLSIEFTPSWLKSKWAELEALIELTFDHEKQADALCRKSAHLVRLLRDSEANRFNSSYTKVIARLESSCSRMSETLSLAQAALRRRKLCLTRWQSDLVELDTLLAEIKTLMGSYEMTGCVIQGDTTSEWLADLRRRLSEPSSEDNRHLSRKYWMSELNPQYNGLGKYLAKLEASWARVQETLSSPDQSMMMVRVPDHIASQIDSLLNEWECLCTTLELPYAKGRKCPNSHKQTADNQVSATVICAPVQWSNVSPVLAIAQSSSSQGGPVGHVLSEVAQTMSPTMTRMRQEVDQLSRWLSAVTNFSLQSRAKLGDRFDQETVNQQLLHAKMATTGGSSPNISETFHPAALQLKIQQFLTELNARKPQLERISVEKERLFHWDSEEALTGQLSSQVESLPQFWDAAEKRMTERSNELEVMITETQKLKDVERDVDRWLARVESEMDALETPRTLSARTGAEVDSPRRLPITPDTGRKRLQEINNSLPEGNNKLNRYREECEALISRFNAEDTSRLQKDLEQITNRWDSLNDRLKRLSKMMRTEASYDDLPHETDRAVLEHTGRASSHERPLAASTDAVSSSGVMRGSSGSINAREKLQQRLEYIERKVTHIGQMESDLQRNCSMDEEPVALNAQRIQILGELQALQSEINTLSSQLSGNVKPCNQESNAFPDTDFLARWRQLRDKVAALRQSIHTSPSHNTLFLARLKQLNNWVAHRDAAFRATVCPLTGNLLFIMKLRDIVTGLFKELEIQSAQIEDVLQQGRIHYGEERYDPAVSVDSEHESDGSEGAAHSDTAPNSLPGKDEHSKRTIRRIRRHLYHLRKRWLALNTNMLDYKQQLDSASERLSNFQSMFNEAVEQIRSAHSVTTRWVPVDCLPMDRMRSELEQAQSFYDACEPLVVLLNNLDRQLLQFQDAQITFEPSLITQQAALRNDLEQVRLLTETRIQAISQTLETLRLFGPQLQHPVKQRASFVHTSSPLASARFAETDLNEKPESLRQTISQSQVETVPLSDSVSPPWERCVHPSGTQVPYYKNHSTQDTQWDHPILFDLLQSLRQYNAVRFAEYRTAFKLRSLQKTLCVDTLSISILAENLKHIGHSQPVDASHNDPFDRTIDVPQMIACLSQLFTRSHASYGSRDKTLINSPTHVTVSNGTDILTSAQSSLKTGAMGKCSTLPHNAKPPTVGESRPTRGTSTKCGGAFRRHSSSTREQRSTATSGDPNKKLLVPNQAPVTLSQVNRSTSLPESVTPGHGSPVHGAPNVKRKRSSTRAKRRYLISPAKYSVNVCVDLTLNWLLNVYDRMRRGNIRALSFKVALTILSVANLDEKYRYLFSLIADTNGCVTEQRLGALLYECVLIPRNLGEGGSIGKDEFANTVRTCFGQVLDIARDAESYETGSPFRGQSVPARYFITWLRLGQPTLMWLPLLHRVMLAEQVVHQVRCGVCHHQPLTGLRYRCLRCLNFDLCQTCFFNGRTARSHKLTHPMQEYCTNSTSGDSLRDFTRIVRNRFRSRERMQRGRQEDSALGSRDASSTRTSSRCCDTGAFAEELSKPRPAPTFGSDLSSLIPREPDYGAQTGGKSGLVRDSFDSVGISSSISRTPVAVEPLISRPMSSQIPVAHLTEQPNLPPRAASDTRQLVVNQYGSRDRRSNEMLVGRQRSLEPLVDDEHQLIAHYSRELRQQTDPNLNPMDQMTMSPPPASVPAVMNRSTISDGAPNGTPLMGLHDPILQYTGHLSLDRRQFGRGPGHTSLFAPNGYHPADGLDSAQHYSRQSGLDMAYAPRHNQQLSNYHIFGQPVPFPLASNPTLPRVSPHDSLGSASIQRSYSLRARSQPPPDVQLNSVRLTPNAQVDPRFQGYPQSRQPGPIHLSGQTNPVMRSLDEEQNVLRMEYDRLHQNGLRTPNYSAPTSSRLQSQQAQQRFARMQFQHQLMQQQQQQQQEALRSSLPRGYGPRPPVHKSSLVVTGAAVGPGIDYSGSLGRANAGQNGEMHYPVDVYGSDSRVFAHPYAPEMTVDGEINAPTAVGEISNETRLLREHRGRLELRMQQLEDQNKQLEQKLHRLRQYLVSGGSSTTGTVAAMDSTRKAATDLLLEKNTNSRNSLRQRSASGGLTGQPGLPEAGHFNTGSGSVGQLTGSIVPPELMAPDSRPITNIPYRSNSDTRPLPGTAAYEYYQVPVDDSYPAGVVPPASDSRPLQLSTNPTTVRSELMRYTQF